MKRALLVVLETWHFDSSWMKRYLLESTLSFPPPTWGEVPLLLKSMGVLIRDPSEWNSLGDPPRSSSTENLREGGATALCCTETRCQPGWGAGAIVCYPLPRAVNSCLESAASQWKEAQLSLSLRRDEAWQPGLHDQRPRFFPDSCYCGAVLRVSVLLLSPVAFFSESRRRKIT